VNDEELLIIAHIEHERLQGFHLQINQQGPKKNDEKSRSELEVSKKKKKKKVKYNGSSKKLTSPN
jgi:hypothetical protein